MIESSNKAPIRILHYGLTKNLGGIEVFVMSLLIPFLIKIPFSFQILSPNIQIPASFEQAK